MSELSDTIEEAAGKAQQSAKGDASLKRHPLPDLIAADQHLTNVANAAARTSGLRFFRQKPRGAWE